MVTVWHHGRGYRKGQCVAAYSFPVQILSGIIQINDPVFTEPEMEIFIMQREAIDWLILRPGTYNSIQTHIHTLPTLERKTSLIMNMPPSLSITGREARIL